MVRRTNVDVDVAVLSGAAATSIASLCRVAVGVHIMVRVCLLPMFEVAVLGGGSLCVMP